MLEQIPKITIAIPYYKDVNLLARAVRSVLAQSSTQWQLLICDDASPEPANEKIDAIMNGQPYRYLRNERNLGMVANWNRCLSESATNFVTLLHADDMLATSYVSENLSAFKRYPTALGIFSNANIIGPTDTPIFSFPDFVKKFLIPSTKNDIELHGDMGLAALLKGNFIMCPTVCYNKTKMTGQYFDPRWKQVQDLDFFARMLLQGETFIGIQARTYQYRRHCNNATAVQTANNSRFHEEFALYAELATMTQVKNWNFARKTAEKALIIKLNVGFNLAKDMLAFRMQDAWTRTQLIFTKNSKPNRKYSS